MEMRGSQAATVITIDDPPVMATHSFGNPSVNENHTVVDSPVVAAQHTVGNQPVKTTRATADPPVMGPQSFGISETVMPGLEAMLDTTHLLVSQKKDVLEMLSSYESSNRYEVFNDQKKQVYYAVEDTLTGAICAQGGNRPFTIRLIDSKGREIMIATSKVHFCTREVDVELPPGTHFALIKEEFAFLHPSFLVNDMAGRTVMKIISPLQAALGSFQDVNFEILASDMKTKIGEISKQWRGFAEEMFSDADVFGLTMPDDLDANWKAVLLAATFLIDFTYYEDAA